ncbi:MAG: hypothetical protein OEV44_10210 [Spirochaetota bacterium]|nr:hypothetical protein [Spirochaetota bacterium]
MYQFASHVYTLVRSPVGFLTNRIEKKDNLFMSFTVLLTLLIACCQYVSFINSFNIGSNLSSFSYIIFMFFYIAFFYIFIFLESSITSYFLKNRNVTPYPFGSKQVYILISLSYFPCIFLPAISLISLGFGNEFYFIFLVLFFILVMITRYRFFQNYSQFFNMPSWALAIIPTLVQLIVIFFVLFFITSAFTIIVINKFQEIMKSIF